MFRKLFRLFLFFVMLWLAYLVYMKFKEAPETFEPITKKIEQLGMGKLIGKFVTNTPIEQLSSFVDSRLDMFLAPLDKSGSRLPIRDLRYIVSEMSAGVYETSDSNLLELFDIRKKLSEAKSTAATDKETAVYNCAQKLSQQLIVAAATREHHARRLANLITNPPNNKTSAVASTSQKTQPARNRDMSRAEKVNPDTEKNKTSVKEANADALRVERFESAILDSWDLNARKMRAEIMQSNEQLRRLNQP